MATGDRTEDGTGLVQDMLALRPRLRRFAYGLARNLDEADDLVQSTYQRAIECRDQWVPGTRLDSWMMRILHTLWLSGRRRWQVRHGQGEGIDPDLLVGSDGERTAHARLLLADVRRLVLDLPDEQRAALLLVTVEGLSYGAAAETLDIPVGTLCSRLARAREQLKAVLEGGIETPRESEMTS